jgi:hypothetical protein
VKKLKLPVSGFTNACPQNLPDCFPRSGLNKLIHQPRSTMETHRKVGDKPQAILSQGSYCDCDAYDSPCRVWREKCEPSVREQGFRCQLERYSHHITEDWTKPRFKPWKWNRTGAFVVSIERRSNLILPKQIACVHNTCSATSLGNIAYERNHDV